MRTREDVYRELGLGADTTSDEARLRAMTEHPILIERPVVMSATHAIIGRPPDNVDPLLDA